jgi:hypothetical protein
VACRPIVDADKHVHQALARDAVGAVLSAWRRVSMADAGGSNEARWPCRCNRLVAAGAPRRVFLGDVIMMRKQLRTLEELTQGQAVLAAPTAQ